jgi:glycosyltransferase involved in cell wall biosynthesis
LIRSGEALQLRLLGAPGVESGAAQAWLAGARERNISEHLSFSGRLPAQELSDELARCEVLLFVDAVGPSSRKGTLVGSLASGRPVLALDGPHRWEELARADALRIVPATAAALGGGLTELLGDPALREAIGARGRAFSEAEMSVARSSSVVRGLAERLTSS